MLRYNITRKISSTPRAYFACAAPVEQKKLEAAVKACLETIEKSEKSQYYCVEGPYSQICMAVNAYVAVGKPNNGEMRDLFNKFGSDKYILYRYTDYYDFFFREMRDEKLNILEIGLGSQGK